MCVWGGVGEEAERVRSGRSAAMVTLEEDDAAAADGRCRQCSAGKHFQTRLQIIEVVPKINLNNDSFGNT